MMSKNVQPQTGTHPFREKKGRKDQVDQILAANFLDYQPVSNISVVDKRSQIRHEFRQQSYEVGNSPVTMELRMGGGDSFIYGPNSYLSFKLKVDQNTAGFGAGSALSLFRDAEMKSQNGNEIDRVEQVGLYANQHIKYTHDASYFTSGQAELIGFDDTFNGLVATQDRTYIIPLKFILPIFGYPGLLPSSGLTAGSVIRLTLQDVTTALVANGAVANYTITDPRIVTDELVLTDAFAKRLQLMSARSGPGLSITWESWYHQQERSAAGTVEVLMANSVSRACRSFGLVRDAPVAAATDSITALSNPDTIEQYQFKLGNLRFPDQRCTDQEEHFANALIAFGSYDKEHGVGANRAAYVNTANGANPIDAGNRVVAASFERNHILSLSGISVNGNRLLRLNLNKDAQDHFVDLFMSYTKHASIHLDTNLISS
jgi:hypothetical protein